MTEHRQTIHLRHANVAQQDVRTELAGDFERFLAVGGGGHHGEALLAHQHRLEALADHRVIVDYHQLDHAQFFSSS